MPSGTLTADAVLSQTRLRTFTADAYIKVRWVLMDSVITKTSSASFTADAKVIEHRYAFSIQAAGFIKRTEFPLYADAIIFRSGMTGSFTANALLKRPGYIGAFTTNSVIKGSSSSSISANAAIVAVGDEPGVPIRNPRY